MHFYKLTLDFVDLLIFDYRSIDMGDSKTYFLCNLDDKIALAESIDSVPMSFTNR